VNGGAAGVDGQRFADIEAWGRERWLGERAEALKARTYQPQAVRRVCIPKPDGKQRPLGIPTIRDRVVPMAVVLVLGPIFEADLPSEQYADRAGQAYLGPRPSKKKIARVCEAISAVTESRTTWKAPEHVVAELNAKWRSWANYFCLGTVVPAYETVMGHARRRLRRWLSVKHQARRRRYATFPDQRLHQGWGLCLLPRITPYYSCANS
jgi:hypothetical protein